MMSVTRLRILDSLVALQIDDKLSILERVQRYITSDHELHRLFTTKLIADAAEVRITHH